MFVLHVLCCTTTLCRVVKFLLTLDTDARQDTHCVVLDLIQHDTKHFKRLALVFLLWILLRVGPQANALTKVFV